MPTEKITSAQNERLKFVGQLHHKKYRDEAGFFVVEGKKEIEFAIRGGFHLQSMWYVDGNQSDADNLVGLAGQDIDLFETTAKNYEKIGYREKTEGILAIVRPKKRAIQDLKVIATSLILVADHIEKPGNLGTLFRIADGVGASAVLLAGLSTDVYNPNVIRNSVGTLFSTPFIVDAPDRIKQWLQEKQFQVVVATPEAKTRYSNLTWTHKAAIIVGREHEGIQSDWGPDVKPVSIPMRGQNDSLNLAVSTGILAYDWLRNNLLG